MRILYVTQTFHPETLGAERLTRQALLLQKLGHDVTVLTTMPYYPRGRVFEGYRGQFIRREKLAGVEVVRVWSVPADNFRLVRRLASYASFSILAALVGLVLSRRDLVIAAVPHPGTELAGVCIAKFKRTRLLLEMVDLLPENLSFIGISDQSHVGRLLSRYYRLVYRQADLIAVLCEAARQVIAEKGVDPDAILLMPNGADPELLDSIPTTTVRRRHGLEDKFVVLYGGSFSAYYEVPNIVAAAERLQHSHPRIHFLLLGDGPNWESVRQRIEQEGLRNVTLAGSVPREEFGGYLQAADVFIFSMVADPTPRPYHGILTAKACDYLLAGKPVIAVESGQILAELLARIGAGEHVAPRNPDALAAAIIAFADDPLRVQRCGAAAAAYAQQHCLRPKVMARFEKQLLARLRWLCAGRKAWQVQDFDVEGEQADALVAFASAPASGAGATGA